MTTATQVHAHLFDALIGRGGFTVRLDAHWVATEVHSGFAVFAPEGQPVYLPCDATFAIFDYALDMLRDEYPHLRGLNGVLGEYGIRLDAAEIYRTKDAAVHFAAMRHLPSIWDLETGQEIVL